MTQALKKSCGHRCDESFKTQVVRLKVSGYPDSMLASVAEELLKATRSKKKELESSEKVDGKKAVVIPYVHRAWHKLRTIADRLHVNVVFSAPLKLEGMC